MRRMTKVSIAVGAALSLGLAAAVVNAHPYGMGWGGGYGSGPGYGMHGYGMGPGMMGGYGPGYGMGPGMMGGYGGYGMGPGMMGGYGYPGPGERLAGLKSELGITAQQESAWQAFVDNAKQQDKNRQAWFAKMREARAAGSAPEMLAQRTEIGKLQQGELEATATALKNLYTALTPEQQAIADQRLAGFGPGYGRGYRGGPGGRFR